MSRLSWYIRKTVRAAGVGLVALLVLLAAAVSLSPYFRRWCFLWYADVYDYDKLPSRTVSRSAQPFHFPDATAGDWIAPLGLTYHGLAITDETKLGRVLADHGTTAFIAIRDRKLLYEQYFNGFRRDSLFKAFSVTKSITSALIGLAIADGLIGSIDDPVTKYIPEMRDPTFTRVTFRQCLDATAGIRYTRGVMPWRDQPHMYYTTDVRGFIRGARIEAEPGTRFSHDDLAPLLLGCALERALQKSPSSHTLSAYLDERVWQPIGAEYDGLWNLDRKDGGLEKAESGFTARAIDLAKLGVLYLDGGRWGTKQVLPPSWVAASSTAADDPKAPNVWRDGFHSLQWWGRDAPRPAPPDFYANGHFGQRIYVSPRNRLVLVRMGDSTGGLDWTGPLAAIADAMAR